MNNRTDTNFQFSRSYNLTIEEIDGERLTFIDYSGENSLEQRAVISYKNSVVMIDTRSNDVKHSAKITDSQNTAYRLLSSQNYLSRINLSMIRQEAQKVSLDIQTDNDSILTLSVPPEMTNLSFGSRRISNKISFDVKEDVLLSTETITLMEDGTVITVTTSPRYERVEGVPVKIGQITTTEVKVPYTSDISYEGVVYDSPDDIPVISNAEYEKLRSEGRIHQKSGIIFGNPNDLSYIETEVELYSSVKINNAPTLSLRPWWLKVIHFVVDPVGATIYEIIDATNNNTNSNPTPPPVPNGHNGKEEPAVIRPFPDTPLTGESLHAKVYSRNDFGYPVYFFDGFPVNSEPSPVGMSEILYNEYQAISRGGIYTNALSNVRYSINKSNNPYAIIGYSMAMDASRAKKLMQNIDVELCKLLGSSENDGFLAVESQYFNQGNVIGLFERRYNHADIGLYDKYGNIKNQEIWDIVDTCIKRFFENDN